MTSHLRPDEQASQYEMSKARGRDEYLKKGIKTAVGVGKAAVGLGLSSKIIPFLSDFIPVDLAIKGISKVSPQLGDFLKNGMAKGLDVKEGFNFIKSQMQPEDEEEYNKLGALADRGDDLVSQLKAGTYQTPSQGQQAPQIQQSSQQGQQPQQAQGGKGQAELMAILQQINQSRGS